jgi:pimeloyl-ACP methyl ester carboxylesterase
MQFAIRHPQRCSGLIVIVPAAHDPGRALESVEHSPLAQAIIIHALRSDFLYWLGLQIAPSQMIKALLATDPELVKRASPAERMRVYRLLWNILPVSARANGFVNDAKLAGAPKPMALNEIQVPTLAISFEDDHFGTVGPARHMAALVPGSRLVIYPTGGHVGVGHDADVFREVEQFLRGLPSR